MDGPPQKASAAKSPERVGSDSANGSPPDDDARAALDKLRELLVRPETQRLDSIQGRIEDPFIRSTDIAEALPEAVRRASDKDPELAAALTPLVEQGLAQSIRRNPAVVIEVIFPILGPAIRRAVASALRGAVESLNRVVEHSFTWRGLRWRMEAWRTGQTVAEVAMTRSLVYRVEQVFLIHRETGLPLMVVGVDEVRHDSDLVSSMLTAIQDFVHDSFSVARDQELDRLEVGDFQVWIERGPRAAVAAVIRGSAPRRLRTLLAETTGNIHAQMRDSLERFDGDSAPFEPVRPLLENCLKQEFQHPKKARGLQPSTIITLAVVGLLVTGFFWLRWRDGQRWRGYLAAVDSTPGLVAVDEGKSWGVRRALVLRDPLAAAPETLLAANDLDNDDVELRIRPFFSTDPEITALRARAALNAPDSVQMVVANNELRLSGSAPSAWIRRVADETAVVPGVSAIRVDEVRDSDREELERRIAELKKMRVLFNVNSASLADSQQGTFDQVAATIQDCLQRAATIGLVARAQLLGGSDPSGTEQTNTRLRRRRAEAVRDRLVAAGVSRAVLSTDASVHHLGESADELRSVAVEIELTADDAAAHELP